MFEGALIAAWAVEAERIYLYMRDEYPAVLHILAHEIAALEKAGIIDKGFIELRRGAGAYICGEESAMIESIEGKRGYPRNRPPYIAEVGLFGRPTLNHNVETLYWVPEILKKGAKWFADHGVNGAKGLRSWSVSGRVKKPGVIVAPAGITARELIEMRRAAWKTARSSRPICRAARRAACCRRAWPTCLSISAVSTNTAGSSAAMPSWCSPNAMT